MCKGLWLRVRSFSFSAARTVFFPEQGAPAMRIRIGGCWGAGCVCGEVAEVLECAGGVWWGRRAGVEVEVGVIIF